MVTRVLPFVRTIMPAAAGASGLRYPLFLAGSTVGSIVWAGTWVSAGSIVTTLIDQVGFWLLIAAVTAVAVVAIRFGLRRNAAAKWSSEKADVGTRRTAEAPAVVTR